MNEGAALILINQRLQSIHYNDFDSRLSRRLVVLDAGESIVSD
jgi:hypothetical protein